MLMHLCQVFWRRLFCSIRYSNRGIIGGWFDIISREPVDRLAILLLDKSRCVSDFSPWNMSNLISVNAFRDKLRTITLGMLYKHPRFYSSERIVFNTKMCTPVAIDVFNADNFVPFQWQTSCIHWYVILELSPIQSFHRKPSLQNH